MFVAFIPSGNELVGIVEAVPRRVGNKKVDLKREAQLRAAGFKVHLLVDRFQVVLWDSLDPKGIELTVAKAPTLITRPLSPQEVARLLIPPKGSASSMRVAGMVPPALLAALMSTSTVCYEEKEPALKKYRRPDRRSTCIFGPSVNVPDNKKACPKPHDDIKCDYSKTKRELTLKSENVFAKSQDDCKKAAVELEQQKCAEQTFDPLVLNCPVVPTYPPQNEPSSKPYACPAIELQEVVVSATTCTLITELDCKDRQPDRVIATLDRDKKLVTCKCFWAAKDDPTCPGDPDRACHYDEKHSNKTMKLIPGEDNKLRVDKCQAECGTQEAKTPRIECAGVEA
jgi:hypothetical protein